MCTILYSVDKALTWPIFRNYVGLIEYEKRKWQWWDNKLLWGTRGIQGSPPPSGNGFMGIVFTHLILMETGEYKMLGTANVTRPKCNFILFDLILLISLFSFVCFILVYFPFLINFFFNWAWIISPSLWVYHYVTGTN